jgi:hypothetical protein
VINLAIAALTLFFKEVRLLWAVFANDVKGFDESLLVTDIVGQQQDQFAIEVMALFGIKLLMHGYQPGVKIIRVFNSWLS